MSFAWLQMVYKEKKAYSTLFTENTIYFLQITPYQRAISAICAKASALSDSKTAVTIIKTVTDERKFDFIMSFNYNNIFLMPFCLHLFFTGCS